jgi:hypothetical protein
MQIKLQLTITELTEVHLALQNRICRLWELRHPLNLAPNVRGLLRDTIATLRKLRDNRNWEVVK